MTGCLQLSLSLAESFHSNQVSSKLSPGEERCWDCHMAGCQQEKHEWQFVWETDSQTDVHFHVGSSIFVVISQLYKYGWHHLLVTHLQQNCATVQQWAGPSLCPLTNSLVNNFILRDPVSHLISINSLQNRFVNQLPRIFREFWLNKYS